MPNDERKPRRKRPKNLGISTTQEVRIDGPATVRLSKTGRLIVRYDEPGTSRKLRLDVPPQ